MSGHVYCYHYITCTKPGKWAVMCIVTITLPVQSQDNERSCVLLPLHYLYKAMKTSGHVCCYHYTTCTKPGQWAVHVYCYHYTTCTKPGKWAVMCIVTITLPVQSQNNERSCVLSPLHSLYKAMKMSGHVCCYHYTTCTKPGKSVVMCIVTITLPVQSKLNERSCVLFMRIVTITQPVQSQVNERSCVLSTITLSVQSHENEPSCVLLPLQYLFKARAMSGHVHCYHYTICTKPWKWAGHVCCYHYTTCTKPGKWAVMCIVTITLPVQSQDNERSCVLLPLHYL